MYHRRHERARHPSHRHLLLPARGAGAVRRRPQARLVPRRHLRPACRVGAGLSGGRTGPRHAARIAPPRAQRRRRANGELEERPRHHRRDARLGSHARRGPRARAPGRLRAQEGLAELRDGARPDLRGGRDGREERPRPVRRGAHRAISAPANRGGGPALRPTPPRELRGARLRLREAARLLRDPLDRRRPREVPHGPQANAARARAGHLLRDGPAGRRRGVDKPLGTRAAVPHALHGRAGAHGHHAQARQRADAHARPLQAAARGRRPCRTAGRHRGLPCGARAAHRAGHALQAPRAPTPCRVPSRPGCTSTRTRAS